VGSVGNLVASYPMALAAEWIGWRASLAGLAGISAIVALGIFFTVRDPDVARSDEKGSVFDLLKLPVLWTMLPLMFVSYAPAGAFRGLWAGPYLSDVFGLNTSQIGQATLVMGLAMIAGTLIYGPMDRILGTRKWIVFTGSMVGALAVLTLAFLVDFNVIVSVGLLALIGVCGAFLIR